MIKSFKHKGLKKFWEKNDVRGVSPQWLKRVTYILDLLEAAGSPSDMDLPGLRFHQRKGNQSHRYSVDLTGGWRITFGWSKKDAVDVDMVEDH
jgi:proteic killer suppression protein